MGTAIIHLTCFTISYLCQFDKLYDFASCLTFLFLSLYSLVGAEFFYPRQLLITVLTSIWALRLGIFLMIRISKRKRDTRFDAIRSDFFQYLAFWLFQILFFWVISLPVIYVNVTDTPTPFSSWDYIGIAIWGIGVVVEAIADQTKYWFNQKKRPEPPFVSTGLWRFSRHPNYFGDILVWIGLCLISISIITPSQPYAWVVLLSPILDFCLLVFISGVPPAEMRNDMRFHDNDAYLAYKNQTSPLILFPPQVYKKLPKSVKKIFFFELGFYSSVLSNQKPFGGSYGTLES